MVTPRAGAALRTKVALTDPILRAAAGRLWRSPDLAGRYPGYLHTMHEVIRASVPLMRLALYRCAERVSTDPVAARLCVYLLDHIEEERGHDDWLLADLAALDRGPAPAAGPPPPAVARLVGPQYYWIEHDHPVALLGYIAVMEGNAPTTALPSWLVSHAGIPVAAVRTVREHAQLDTGHTDAVYDLLDALPLTAAQATAVAVSGLHTVDALVDLFLRLSTVAPEDGPAPVMAPPGKETRDDRPPVHAGGP
jgi:hypothetical protein